VNFLNGLKLVATTTIYPSTFCTIDSASNFGVKPATLATDFPIAVSQPGTAQFPGAANAIDGSTSAQPAAQSGQELGLFGVGDICDITVGSAAVTAGQRLTNDGNANAIPATSGKYYGAIALQSGAVGELIQVLVIYGYNA
jgi:hypothetical protein